MNVSQWFHVVMSDPEVIADRPPAGPHVVLMCGIAGAGKTTYAKRLEARGYVRLSIDEELWRRSGCGGGDPDRQRSVALSAVIEQELAGRLVDLIGNRRDVVVGLQLLETLRPRSLPRARQVGRRPL